MQRRKQTPPQFHPHLRLCRISVHPSRSQGCNKPRPLCHTARQRGHSHYAGSACLQCSEARSKLLSRFNAPLDYRVMSGVGVSTDFPGCTVRFSALTSTFDSTAPGGFIAQPAHAEYDLSEGYAGTWNISNPSSSPACAWNIASVSRSFSAISLSMRASSYSTTLLWPSTRSASRS